MRVQGVWKRVVGYRNVDSDRVPGPERSVAVPIEQFDEVAQFVDARLPWPGRRLVATMHRHHAGLQLGCERQSHPSSPLGLPEYAGSIARHAPALKGPASRRAEPGE